MKRKWSILMFLHVSRQFINEFGSGPINFCRLEFYKLRKVANSVGAAPSWRTSLQHSERASSIDKSRMRVRMFQSRTISPVVVRRHHTWPDDGTPDDGLSWVDEHGTFVRARQASRTGITGRRGASAPVPANRQRRRQRRRRWWRQLRRSSQLLQTRRKRRAFFESPAKSELSPELSSQLVYLVLAYLFTCARSHGLTT